MEQLKIDTDGRKLIENKIIEQTHDTIISQHIYDDGTIFDFKITGDEIFVNCNKPLQQLSDGTIKIIG